jgi:hypothetical protein
MDLRQEPVAWRVYSRLLDCELWLARDERVRDELVAEDTTLPVLLLAEVPNLAGKAPALLRALLRTKCAFPGARWVQ